MFVQGKLVYPITNVYGCLCDFKEEGIQAITPQEITGSYSRQKDLRQD